MAALCISTAAFAQKDKVVEASSKRKPAWIGSSDRSHFAVTEVGETLAAASGKCMASIRQYIVNAVAVNVSSAEKMATRQITRDHSMVQQLVDSGKITREQAAQHPKKNLITRALGVSANIVPEYNRCEIEVGDILLLCSDGLTNMISDEEIALVLREVPFFEAPSILVDRALQAGGQDNITVLLMGVEITEVNHG